MNQSMVIVYSIVFCLIVVLFSRSIVKMLMAAHTISTKKKTGTMIEDSDKITFIDAKTNFSLNFIFLLGFMLAMIILKSRILPWT